MGVISFGNSLQQERETYDRTTNAFVGKWAKCCTIATASGPFRCDTGRAPNGLTLSHLRTSIPPSPTRARTTDRPGRLIDHPLSGSPPALVFPHRTDVGA